MTATAIPCATASAPFVVTSPAAISQRHVTRETPSTLPSLEYVVGPVASGWEIHEPIQIRTERDDNQYITTDSVSVVYGLGDTPELAQRDYLRSLIDYYELLAARREDRLVEPQFRRLRRYLRPRS